MSSKDFDTFWIWFAPCIHKIRHTRQLLQMWIQGFVDSFLFFFLKMLSLYRTLYGFLSKNVLNEILTNQQIGSYVIRFSEKNPGQMTIGYVTSIPPEPIRHYLLKTEDTAGKKTLADFIYENNQFRYVIQHKHDMKTGTVSHRSVEKLLALESFLPKDKRVVKTEAKKGSYDDQLV